MTNETLETIKNRRSCRAYKPEQITNEELDAVLEAGTYAASAMGRQSAKIVVVQDAAARAQLTRMNAAVMGRDTDPMYGAPTILVVLADAHAANAVPDGSLVMGNLMLAAASLGLGSCWINRAKEEFETEEGKALPVQQFFKALRYRHLKPAEQENGTVPRDEVVFEHTLG